MNESDGWKALCALNNNGSDGLEYGWFCFSNSYSSVLCQLIWDHCLEDYTTLEGDGGG